MQCLQCQVLIAQLLDHMISHAIWEYHGNLTIQNSELLLKQSSKNQKQLVSAVVCTILAYQGSSVVTKETIGLRQAATSSSMELMLIYSSEPLRRK